MTTGVALLDDVPVTQATAAAPAALRGGARIARLMPWMVAGLVLAVGLLLVDGLPVGTVHDDGMYVILAKSLATGQGYRWLHVPGAPPATHFPPGYPAVLALVWTVFPAFPQNVIAFKILNAAFLAAAAFGVVVFARRRLAFGPWGAALLAVCGSLAIPTLVLSTLVMSEPMFLALLMPLLLYAERIVEDRQRNIGRVVALGALVGVATLVRSHGIALVPAVAALFLYRRRWRDAAVYVACTVVVMLPWQLWVRAHEGFVPGPMRGNYESYTAWLFRGLHDDGVMLIARTLGRTSLEILAMLAAFAAPTIAMPAARVALLVFVVALIGAGLWRVWQRAPVTALFIVCYFAIVLTWPFTPARFIWGLWPLLFALPVVGAVGLREWRPAAPWTRAVRYVLLAAVVFTAGGYGVYSARGYRGRWWSTIPRQGTARVWPLVRWTAAHTRPNEVVMSNVEPLLYLYTGRRTVPATSFSASDYFRPASAAASSDAVRGILAAYHVDAVAVVAADSLSAAVMQMASHHPPELALRDSFPNGLIFSPVPR